MNNWSERIEEIKISLDNGDTLEAIGKQYGVSRQRIYQVLEKFGIPTPMRTKKSFLRDKPPKYYWFNKMLIGKEISKPNRRRMLETIEPPEYCPVSGVKLNYSGTGTEGWSRGEDSPSIDQVDAGKGYTIDNIAIMSWRANRIKNDGTAEEHRQIADFIDKFKID